MFWMRSTISIYKVWIIVKHQSTTQNSQVSNLDLRFMKWWVKGEPSQAVNFNTEGKKVKSRATVTESRQEGPRNTSEELELRMFYFREIAFH